MLKVMRYMFKDYKLYVEDMLEFISKLEKYTKNITFEQFLEDDLLQDAVLRNLTVMGEAAKHIPEELRLNNPSIKWRQIIGLRNILIHAYPNIDEELVWNIVKNDLSGLKESLKNMLES
jgi:uncharacterized protein with HEPN domain